MALALREAGFTWKIVSEKTGMTFKALSLLFRRAKQLQKTVPLQVPGRKAGSGLSGPSLETLWMMKAMIRKNPMMTARQMKAKLSCVKTWLVRRIQNTLRKNCDLPSRHAAKKPFLSATMKA